MENKDPMERQPPNDLATKRQLHEKADEKNTIGTRWGRQILLCGGKRKKGICRQLAGFGTPHLGYGRCKFCGGTSTGPRTAEGKAAASKNSRKHGLYAAALNEEEAAIFDELAEAKALDLEGEIYTLKAKIIYYLQTNKGKQERRRTAVEGAINSYEWYTVGTIDDRPFIRALSELGRLVEKHARLTQASGEDLLSSINQELQQASQGQVAISWGGKPQTRAELPNQ